MERDTELCVASFCTSSTSHQINITISLRVSLLIPVTQPVVLRATERHSLFDHIGVGSD
jgi:hypothetical protein